MDYRKTLSESFLAIKDRSNWKYFFAFFFLQLAGYIFLVAGGILWDLLGGTQGGLYNAGLQILGILIIWAGGIVFVLLLFYVQFLAMIKALKDVGIGAAPFGIVKFIKTIILEIVTALAALLCVFNLYFLILPIIIISLTLCGLLVPDILIKIIAVLLLIVFGLLYLIVVVYNHFRLCLPREIFLSKDIGIIDAVRESWKTTKGNLINLFLITLIFGLICICSDIAFAVAIPFLSGQILTGGLILVLGALGAAIGWGIIFAVTIIESALRSYLMLAGCFFAAAVYREVLADNKKRAGAAPPWPKKAAAEAAVQRKEAAKQRAQQRRGA